MTDEDDEVTRHPTQDEAIAATYAESEPGDIITVHDTACAIQIGEECDCEVIRIVVGEHQA